jgi:hypothetical protein
MTSQTKRLAATSVESEESLIARAREAISQCRWVVGECAARWTERYARGRTDADFAALIGLTADQVYQRRRVWEVFSSVRGEFEKLSWSHFYAAVTWPDAGECLQWAVETQSTVAEMRAWRRARLGEDLTQVAEEEAMAAPLPEELAVVQIPGGPPPGGALAAARAPREGALAGSFVEGVSREAVPPEGYAPFRAGVLTPPQKDVPGAEGRPATRPEKPDTEEIVRKMTATLQRFVRVIDPAFRREFKRLPGPVKEKFLEAAERFDSQVAELA